MPLPKFESADSESTPSGSTCDDHPKRVLVVHDSRDSAEMLCEVLKAYGCATHLAYDGPQALEVAESFKPEIALVDIGLPQMDGYELARRLRDHPELRGIKLIAVTGYADSSDRRRSAQAGFDHHVVKPIDLNELRCLITT
jgi:CheY-like chemotaxis protein